jgi:hypothetical protein
MNLNKEKFAIFILTHGRPHNVVTVDSLRKQGYTGRIYLIVDNEDKTVDQYIENYGKENVVVFDKAAAGETFDIADTQTDRRATVFARNASFGIAKQLGLDYYAQFDDDYTLYRYRREQDGHMKSTNIKCMDDAVDAMLDLLNDTGATSVAMSQGGEHIGGTNSGLWKQKLKRKAMNSWFFRTDTPVTFVGRMNDDVSTYVVYGTRGQMFFTTANLQLDQAPTQKVAGGMTEMYLESGTYMKTMYSVMMAPSCVRVSYIGTTNPRIHHHVLSNNAYPKIISDQYCKTTQP